MALKNITVRYAAELIGLTDRAVYKAIDQLTIPAEKEMVNRKTEVRIPAIPFLSFLKSERERLNERIRILNEAEIKIRRQL